MGRSLKSGEKRVIVSLRLPVGLKRKVDKAAASYGDGDASAWLRQVIRQALGETPAPEPWRMVGKTRTMSKFTRVCQKPYNLHVEPCAAETNRWRACPDKSCGREIAYCTGHGGDERATAEMEKHVTDVHKKAAAG